MFIIPLVISIICYICLRPLYQKWIKDEKYKWIVSCICLFSVFFVIFEKMFLKLNIEVVNLIEKIVLFNIVFMFVDLLKNKKV